MCGDIFSLCNTFSWTLINGLHCPPQFLLLWKRQQLICMLTLPFSALLPGGDSRSMSTSNGINIFMALHPKRFAKAVGWLTSHQLGPPCPHHYFVILTNSKTILFKRTITESPKTNKQTKILELISALSKAAGFKGNTWVNPLLLIQSQSHVLTMNTQKPKV